MFGPPRPTTEYANSGFRLSGVGGLANIGSILGASGITFRTVDDSDEEEEMHLVNSAAKSPENSVSSLTAIELTPRWS